MTELVTQAVNVEMQCFIEIEGAYGHMMQAGYVVLLGLHRCFVCYKTRPEEGGWGNLQNCK